MPPTCVLISVAWLWLVCACDAQGDPARELERRILAPCCYRQSLEDHESPIATAIREEIAHRIALGEAPAYIEEALVRRYGEDVRAAPPARWVAVLCVAAAAAAGMMLVLQIARRRSTQVSRSSPASDGDDPYADQLDDELAAVD